jgi:uncharacterized protein YlxW (UPF0749 family)
MSTRRVDESMALITELREGSLEPGYAAASARRVAEGLPKHSSGRSPMVIAVAVACGFLLVVSALSLKSATSVVEQARADLKAQIGARQEAGDLLAERVSQLEAEVAGARSAALGQSGRSSVLTQLSFLQVVGGVVAVTGPGITVTLDDSADAVSGSDPARGSSGFEEGRVSAADLQIVSNGLWAAGAEAISINGQRLTTRSAIRFAGQAILVDFRPLVRPYVVTAIGDPKAMQASFGSSATGSYLKSLEDNYGIPVAITAGSALTCPAGVAPALISATARPDGIPSTSSPTTRATAASPTTQVTRPSPTTRATRPSPSTTEKRP